MQTFLPYADFKQCAKVLDYRRLGKQRLEARQIIHALLGQSKGWRHHTITKKWEGYTVALTQYYNAMVREWIARGYRNTMELYPDEYDYPRPPWTDDPAIHKEYQRILLQKDAEYYGQFFTD